MHTDTLHRSMHATHAVLRGRLDTAAEKHGTHDRPRDRYPATDTFLASTSRHLAAVNAVLVPELKHLPDGPHRCHEFSQQCRSLEAALALVKARLYGSVYAVTTPWPEVWAEVRREFDATLELEKVLVDSLDHDLGSQRAAELSERLYRAEQKAPTRPHPYVPHLGVSGRVARRVCRQVDNFWDTAEGRMIPEPVRVHDRAHQGRLTQYLLADPHMGEDVD
jgi:hypothetical protein